METIDIRVGRRLALARAGLLKPAWTGFPERAAGSGKRARRAALAVVDRFGYLQLDTVSIAGARSHAIVLLSRLAGFDPALAEEILRPGEPLFEYWGHEASWIPLDMYPVFAFRRREFRKHPWWGDLIAEHPETVRGIRKRLREEGPLRSLDLEGQGSRGWWKLKLAKRVANAMWSSGELAIRERRSFQRSYDFAERVIPERWRARGEPYPDALETLLLKALDGHGWATTGTLTATWRLANRGKLIASALDRLVEKGRVVPCALVDADGRRTTGWARPEDLELAARLGRVRPREDRGVLLSPFDPLLWDRGRVRKLFGFDQVLEIFKPARKRVYGYYCLPVLAGERLIARFDLKADRKAGRLRVLSCRFEDTAGPRPASAADGEAAGAALARYAASVELETTGWRPRAPARVQLDAGRGA
ncbi:MAG: crosslink repair DNA glycosylase YcaQ family protein [Myxococcota bacterium]